MSKKTAYELVLGGVIKATKDVEDLADKLNKLEKELSDESAGTLKFERLQKEIELVDIQSKKAQQQLEKFNNVKFDKATKTVTGLKMNFKDIATLATGGASTVDLLTKSTQALGIESTFLTSIISKFGDTSKVAWAAATTSSTRFTTALKMGLISTGLGAFIVIIGSLIAYFKNTQEGSDKLSSKMAYLGGIVTGVANQFVKLGKWIVDMVSQFNEIGESITKLADDVSDYFKKVIESPRIILDNLFDFVVKKFGILGKIIDGAINFDMEAMGDGIAEFYTGVEGATTKVKNAIDTTIESFKKIGDEILSTAERSQRLEDATQAFDKTSKSIEITIRQLERQKEKYLELYRTSASGEQARRDAMNKAKEIDNQIFANKTKLLKGEHALIKLSNTLADTGREDAHKEAIALDNIQANREAAQKKTLEYHRMNTELTKEYSEVAMVRTTTELQAVIDANNRKLESDRLTHAERAAIMIDSADIQTKLLNIQLKELKAAGQMAETLKQIETTKQALKNVDISLHNELKKLDDDYIKRNNEALLREQKAIVERKKLANERIKIDVDLYDELKNHTTTELDELLSIIDTKGDEKLKLIRDINEDEIREEIKRHLKYMDNKGLSDGEIVAAEQEHQLKLEQLQKDLGDKEVAVIKEVTEKKKAIRKADADAHQKKLDDELDALTKQFDLYNKIFDGFATGIQSITDLMADNTVSVFESKLKEVDVMIQTYKGLISDVESQLKASENNIDNLEAKLMNAKGVEREIIIKRLEAERKKQKELARERKAEDDRIKKAEKEKIRLEGEKEKAIAKQIIVTQILAIAQNVLNAAEALSAGLKASKEGKFGWDNIAILVAMTAATITSMAAIKGATKKGFAEGGYTGNGNGTADSTGFKVAGVVHEDEYVAPKWMVEDNPLLFKELEKMRKRKTGFNGLSSNKFAIGGYTTPSMNIATKTTEQVSTVDLALLEKIDTLILANEKFANRPVVVEAVEVVNTAQRVAAYSEYSIK
jgi:hypothetical protein